MSIYGALEPLLPPPHPTSATAEAMETT